MPAVKYIRRAITLCFFLTSLTFGLSGTVAGPFDRTALGDPEPAIRTGAKLERSRRWLDAIGHYETAVKQWPDSKKLTYGLRRSKIHFGIERRYSDDSFRTKLMQLPQHKSLVLFDAVLEKVRSHYVDPLSSTSFVAHGTESLYLAMANEKFLERHLPGVDFYQPGADRDRLKRMRRILREQYWNKRIANSNDAHQTVSRVCEIADSLLGLSSTAVVMEYVFGGCNALDDYSNQLTPDRLADLYDNIDGEFVGLGIEMKAEMGKGLLLVHVLPDSPAADGGVRPGEHIVSIDETDCREMSTDEAASLLRGPSGSRVRIGLTGITEFDKREATLVRRAVQVKSIPIARIIDKSNGVGYMQMTGFQKTSAVEMDAALSQLQRDGMRALIWDVRGNPGGLLTAAVEVLDRFIDDGVLVSTRGRTADQNWSYTAHRPGTSDIPLVLLTDGNSASASEIVAGAIRDHHRGVIVGRKTYGKWSVQSIFPIRESTGLRLTTAKFYSPHGHTLGKIGVKPDVSVPVPEDDVTTFFRGDIAGLMKDKDVQKGLELLRRQLSRR